jgi:hypothetical protein
MYSWAPNFEIFRSIVSICLLTFLTESQFLFNEFYISYIVMILYFITTIIATLSFKNKFKHS